MNKIFYAIVTIFFTTEIAVSAMSDSSSSSNSSSSASYSSSSDNSDRYAPTSRFKEINKLIKLEKFAEAHTMLKGLKKINTDDIHQLIYDNEEKKIYIQNNNYRFTVDRLKVPGKKELDGISFANGFLNKKENQGSIQFI